MSYDPGNGGGSEISLPGSKDSLCLEGIPSLSDEHLKLRNFLTSLEIKTISTKGLRGLR